MFFRSRAVLLCAWTALFSASAADQQPAPHLAALQERLHTLDFNAPYRVRDYAFLKTAVGERSLVQLGESIHVTRELPRARLALVKYLHEEMGFDVIAFEGSVLDAWLAQDHLYRTRSTQTEVVRQAQELAWFTLWQTEAMREVMAYIASTQAGKHPLYLASFDVQPGTSRAQRGSGPASLAAFFAAVQAYAPPRDTNAFARWQEALAPGFGGWGATHSLSVEQTQAAELAIGEIEYWLRQAAPRVAKRTTPMHAAALLRAPECLRAVLALRQAAGKAGAEAGGNPATARLASMRAYQGARDGWNATNALALRASVSRSHRIMLWAHHSHVNHNTRRAPIPTMGQYLLAAAGDSLYTIGLFAGDGEALYVNDAATPPIQLRKLRPAAAYGIEGSLEKLAAADFFLDLTAPGDWPADWTNPATSRIEADGERSFVLAKDFHAAVFVHVVHPEALDGISTSH